MTFRMATVTLIDHILGKNCQLFTVRVAPLQQQQQQQLWLKVEPQL